MKKIKIIFIIIILISLVWIFDLFKSNKSLEKSFEKTKIKINNKEINSYVVDNPITRAKGLSIFNSLNENEGMIFLFSDKSTPKKIGIWMQGMKFDIDIIWIRNNKIVHIEKNAPYPRNLIVKSYYPEELADAVLEVNSGFVDKNNIKINDYVDY